MVTDLKIPVALDVQYVHRHRVGKCERHLNTVVALSFRSLHTSTRLGPVSSYVFKVQCCGDNFNIVEGELRTLCYYTTIGSDHSAAIIIETVPIASLLVGVQVDASKLTKLAPK